MGEILAIIVTVYFGSIMMFIFWKILNSED
jgi:hypothetical protein